jgi:hypothetical protein
MLGVLITSTRIFNERVDEGTKKPLSAAENEDTNVVAYCRMWLLVFVLINLMRKDTPVQPFCQTE